MLYKAHPCGIWEPHGASRRADSALHRLPFSRWRGLFEERPCLGRLIIRDVSQGSNSSPCAISSKSDPFQGWWARPSLGRTHDPFSVRLRDLGVLGSQHLIGTNEAGTKLKGCWQACSGLCRVSPSGVLGSHNFPLEQSTSETCLFMVAIWHHTQALIVKGTIYTQKWILI